MPSTGRSYHVNGPAVLMVQVGGTGSLAALGVSEDGVDIDVDERFEEVRSDAAGAGMPADLQRMGATATIRAKLVDYDLGILQSIRRPGDQTSGEDGLMPTPGSLVGSGGSQLRLGITSGDEPWYFPCCVLRPAKPGTLGTKYTTQQLTFFAWVFVPAGSNTARTLRLYSHTLPA